MSKIDLLSRQEVIEQLAAELNGPVPIKEFIQQVLSMWHSTAKNPESGVRGAIRNDYEGSLFLFLDNDTIVPTRVALKGIRLRVPLTEFEVEHKCLRFTPAFAHIVTHLPRFQEIEEKDIRLVDENGRSLPTKFLTYEREEKDTIFGLQISKLMVIDLADWQPMHEAQLGDSVIITILDWENGRFQLALEPAGQRQEQAEAVAQRNQMLADTLYADLELSRYESLEGQRAVPTALIRLPQDDIIPDHWLWVIKEDGRMDWWGHDIKYKSDFTMLDLFFDDLKEDEEEQEQEMELSAAEKQQVYQFKAYLTHRKGLWRRLEIQGEQTLADLDDLLHDAFEHGWDHLSGFWQLISRGKGRRPREIELATIYPFGDEGFGEDVQIATLGLEKGDKLKYVFDFGDWIDHRLELEAITRPEPGVEYPRQVTQNKPRYKYCIRCKEDGKKKRATWICIECSNEEQREVVICEACLQKYHEVHYAEEILY